jgi:hypothetical protein
MAQEPESDFAALPPEPETGAEAGADDVAAGETHAEAESPEPPEPRSVIDAVADLLQFIVDWLRQEAEALMHDKVVLPMQRLGLTLASASAAGCLAALGIGFISVGVFMLLGEWLTYPGALLAVGGVLLLGSVVFTVIKMRSIQK